jgi:hypothetical protein
MKNKIKKKPITIFLFIMNFKLSISLFFFSHFIVVILFSWWYNLDDCDDESLSK